MLACQIHPHEHYEPETAGNAQLGLSAIGLISGGNRAFQISSAYIESNSSGRVAYAILLEFHCNFACSFYVLYTKISWRFNMKLSQLFYNCAYTAPYVQAGDSVNYAFVEEGTTLYIYFQGSNSITDWVRNFLFGKKPYKDMETPYRVHRGFLAA